MAAAAIFDGTTELFLHDAMAFVIPCPELAEGYERKRNRSTNECAEALEAKLELEDGAKAEEENNSEPTSFLAALKDKYAYTEHVSSPDAAVETFITDFVIIRSPRRRRGNSASLSGGSTDDNEDDAPLGHLITVSFAGTPLSGAGDLPPAGLVGLCPNVAEVDLTNTGLDWNSVLDIFAALPKLNRARLSRNPLGNTEAVRLPRRLPLPKLDFLDLTDTKIDWPDLQNVGKWFPHLRQLQVCCNGLSTICAESLAFFARLETLLLNDNRVRDWNQVWKLSSLPKLETLVLSGNPLESIGYNVELHPGLPDFVPEAPRPAPPSSSSSSSTAARSLNFGDDSSSSSSATATSSSSSSAPSQQQQQQQQQQQRLPFGKLANLTLTDTALSCWTDLEALTKFPKLDHARLKGIPLLDSLSVRDNVERRGFLIACHPNVGSVNGSPVTDEERLKCERAFVRHFSTFSSEQRPLRYHQLVDIHGALEPLPDLDLGIKTHERLRVFVNGSCLFSVDVKLADPTKQLYEVVAKKLKCQSRNLIIYHNHKDETGAEALDQVFHGHMPLSRYGFSPEDALLVDGDFDLPEQILDAIKANGPTTTTMTTTTTTTTPT